MTLQDLCEPLFQEVCRLNRLARKGGASARELGGYGAELRGIFEKMRAAAAHDVGLLNQYEKVEKPLVYFLDFMVSESDLPWSKEWRWLEEEMYDELVGQTKFFELLDQTLDDTSLAANERLEVFYKCLGLGFSGFYSDEPAYLRRKMSEIQSRIKDRVELQSSSRIVPETELQVNTSELYEPPSPRLVMMCIALAGMIVALFVVNYFLYDQSRKDLRNALTGLAAIEADADLSTRDEQGGPGE